MPKMRVLVVEDSTTVRERLVEALKAGADFDIVGVAEDGKQGVDLARLHRPDVITMDMMMPVMTGLEATEHIMAHFPTPILIVSSSVNRGELFRVYDALAAGAVDVLEKPTGAEVDGDWEHHLRAAVRLVAKIKVITHPRARLGSYRRPVERFAFSRAAERQRERCEVLAIGASTGGPAAVREVLQSLPPQFCIPVLVVVHMNAPFESAFAEWLGTQIDRRVVSPQSGTPIAALRGCVAVAPGDRHLVVCNDRLLLNRGAQRHSCRPSVDVLFESVAAEYGAGAAACLLTGMGKDGASGLLDVRHAGGVTIAQDEASSIVYGMPREAVALGAATFVLPLKEIGSCVAALRGAVMELSQ